MNSMAAPKKKSPSSKGRRKAQRPEAAPCERRPRRSQTAATTSLRQEDRAWLYAELPTQLERDTMLTPEWIAESVVMDVERFLNANLPAGFTERLAAKAYYCYDHNKHFHQGLNRAGNGGRATLYMFMRHWTAAWLKRECSALYKKLPVSFGNGQALPVTAPGVTKNYPAAAKLVTEDCIRPA